MVYIFQYLSAALLLVFSTFISWYEGSGILDNPWEWGNSTSFSQLVYGEVHSKHQILQADHFVYAAKFHPAFPALMVLSSLYLIILLGYHLLRGKKKMFAYYLSVIAAGLLTLSYVVASSPTTGGHILFLIWGLSGMLCAGAAAGIYFYSRKKIMG